MSNRSEVAVAKANATGDLERLDAETALHRAFSQQTEADFVECWVAQTSQALEADLRKYQKK